MQKLKNLYTLQGSWGYFGMTSAMFRRCEEMSKRGVASTSLTLDFVENIYDFEQKARDANKIHESVVLRNPYLDMAKVADKWFQTVGGMYLNHSHFAYYNKSNDCFEYYKPNGCLVNEASMQPKKLIKELKDGSGNSIQRTYHTNERGGVEVEYCFSPNGLCLSIRRTNLATKKLIDFLVFDYQVFVVREYESSYDWSIEWIDSIIKNPEQSMIVVDGPGSARKLASLATQNICKVYVLHNNHNDDNGKLTKRDEWNIKNRHKFDAVVALTDQHTNDLVDEFGKEGFCTIPNFTKLTVKQLDIQPIANRVGFFGQLIDRKGVKDAIQAIAILHKNNIPATLDIFGVTPNLTDLDKTLETYGEVVQQYRLEQYVTFHGYTQNTPEEMAKSQCVIFPSYSEAQPMTIIEAMLVGTPVVSYNCKYGPAYMIEHHRSGMLVDKVGDVGTLAKYVYEVLSKPDFRKMLSDNAKIQAQKFTDSDSLFQKWLDVFGKKADIPTELIK